MPVAARVAGGCRSFTYPRDSARAILAVRQGYGCVAPEPNTLSRKGVGGAGAYVGRGLPMIS